MGKHSDEWPLLKETRRRLGLTQAEMAGRLNTPLVTYKGWESGRYKPPGVAIAFCRYLRRELGSRAIYDHADIGRRYIAGESTIAIAKALRCDPNTVRAALITRGVELRPYGRKLSDAQEQAVVVAYLDGERAADIAERYNIHPNHVSYLARKAGHRRRAQRG